MAMSSEAELGVPCSIERENRKFGESPVGLLISLRAVAQKLQCPRGSESSEGFPQLLLFIFYEKKCLEIFSFLQQLLP
jgi:hypothetical protein